MQETAEKYTIVMILDVKVMSRLTFKPPSYYSMPVRGGFHDQHRSQPDHATVLLILP